MRSAARPVALLVLLVCLSYLNDPNGYLGTDTGGKTATLEAMVDRGDWSPDVGYWAEAADPDGRFHPLYGTTRTDRGWVQVTSLPMLFVARPLWAVGGYRAALLVPMAGTVLAALAASALARRLGTHADGPRAFWIIGSASPLLIYGLDLWEHALGVAGLAWAAVLLHDAVVDSRPTIHLSLRALAAGGLMAAAATLRTEALVYTVVVTGSACAWIAWSRSPLRSVLVGSATVVGFVPVWVANAWLERTVGGQSRTSRATGAAEGAGTEGMVRLEEGLRTTFGTFAGAGVTPIVLGVAIVGVVAMVVRIAPRLAADRVPFVLSLLVVAVVVVLAPGLGFVPGLFPAFPVAVAALGVGRRERSLALVAGAALVALPVVWGFQFVGGAGPQWGGRYVLASSFALGVVGAVVIGRLLERERPARAIGAAVVGLSVATTAFGAAWLSVRSREVVRLFDDVVAMQEDALVARNPFLLREAGPRHRGMKWLSAEDPSDVGDAVRVLADLGIRSFTVVQTPGFDGGDISGAARIGVDRVHALDTTFELVHYELSG